MQDYGETKPNSWCPCKKTEVWTHTERKEYCVKLEAQREKEHPVKTVRH